MEKELACEQRTRQAGEGEGRHELDRDAETGLGVVDIQRIEKVYRYEAWPWT